MNEVHSVENIPVLPPGLPATDPAAPKVAMDANQIDALRGAAGDLIPTLKKWWAVFCMVAALAYGISQMDVSKLMPPTKVDNSRLQSLEKDRDDLLKLTQQQKVVIDNLSKKGTP